MKVNFLVIKTLLVLLIVPVIFSCKNAGSSSNLSTGPHIYNTSKSDGIYFEEFPDSVQNINKYSDDNEIYHIGRSFTYEYQYIDKEGNAFYYEDDMSRSTDLLKQWKFVPVEKLTAQTVTMVRMSVGNSKDSSYNQSVINFEIYTNQGESLGSQTTGLVENRDNIWIHPPRYKLFTILQVNPYPFIQRPYRVGNKYSWHLRIGGFWGDERWRTWEGLILNQQNYEIIAEENLKTNLGLLKCLKIAAIGSSELGMTYLISYFNEEYGFIKYEYTNIDGSKLNMTLVAVEEKVN